MTGELLERCLFWPISEAMRLLQIVFWTNNPGEAPHSDDEKFGFRVGIAITFALLVAGAVTGFFVISPVSLLMLWIDFYIVGACIEVLLYKSGGGALQLLRFFLDGFVIGMTLRYPFLRG